MGDFPPAEHYGYLRLILLTQKTFDVSQLELIVMFFGFWADLHFFYLDGGLFFLSLLQFLALQVFVLAIVHYLADRGRRLGRDLHQVQSFFLCTSQCLFQRYNPQLGAVYSYKADLGSPNPAIYVNVLDYFPSLLSEISF